jgi:hypothetical protein
VQVVVAERSRAGSDGGPSGSLGSVRGENGRAPNCYTFRVAVKDGEVVGPDGKPATVGSKHKLSVEARGTDGPVTDTFTFTLSKRSATGRPGKRLGC